MSLSKKQRRRERYERNVQKEKSYKKEAWESGKLIEENHNGGPYSEDYTKELCSRLVEHLLNDRKKSNSPEDYVKRFRMWKMKIQDLILHWNLAVPKTEMYQFLKHTLEVYWDCVVERGEIDSLIKIPHPYDK